MSGGHQPALGRAPFAADRVFERPREGRDCAAVPGAVLLVVVANLFRERAVGSGRTPAAPSRAIHDLEELSRGRMRGVEVPRLGEPREVDDPGVAPKRAEELRIEGAGKRIAPSP